MQISKKEVIQQNADLMRGIVTDIRPGDDLATLVNRVGSRVTVTPDDAQAEEVTVTIAMNAVAAVSKGADLGNILSLLNAATNGSVLALGTGFTTGGLAAVPDLADATVRTLSKIMTKVQSQDNARVIIPVKKIDRSIFGGNDVEMSATVTGWTVTTDWDSDEIANFSYKCALLNRYSSPAETVNVGTQSQKRINGDLVKTSVDLTTDSMAGIFDMDWNLSTDGAFTHDTISTVQIANITLVFKYV